MKIVPLLFAFSALPAFAQAGEPPALAGRWIVPGACPLSFEIQHGEIVRTSGTLSYRTRAELQPQGQGWRLDETALSHNEGRSCRGEPAEAVLAHLETKAYIELEGDRLRYSRGPGQPPALVFVHDKG